MCVCVSRGEFQSFVESITLRGRKPHEGRFPQDEAGLGFYGSFTILHPPAREKKGGAWILIPETEQFCGLPFACRK